MKPTFPSVNYQLEHLVLAKCDYRASLVIIQQFPHLKTFEMGMCTIMNSDEIVTSSTGSSFVSPLKTLIIRDCCLSPESLTSLLTITPMLVHLELISKRTILDQLFDGFYWKNIIQTKLRSLITFDFVFSCKLDQTCTFIHINQLISTFQSDFWIYEKRWFIGCTYIIKSCKVLFHASKTDIDSYHFSPRCVFSTMDSVWCFAQRVGLEETNTVSIEVGGKRHRRISYILRLERIRSS
jgi:hypothetical protein